ncbi:MAG TPA: carboxypeptidase-like regulatory domain-containing protein, partial [Bacteroidales bacterium]|nr:carboxypeptidase-like regulatory domain-containing protein [Bacteroidales bacterium]
MKVHLQLKSLLLIALFVAFSSVDAIAQHTVSGRVIDASTSETLPAVNILVKGTTRGTSTNAEGEYELTVPSPSDTLIFSYVGYQKQIIPIDGR